MRFLFFLLTSTLTLDASFQEKDSLRKRWELLRGVEEGTPGLSDHPFIRQSEREFHNLKDALKTWDTAHIRQADLEMESISP